MEDPVEVVFGNEPEVGKSEEAEDKVISNTIEPSSSPAPPPPPHAPSVREVENLDDESQFGPTSTISRPIATPRNQEKTTRKRCRYFCLFVLVVLLLLLVGILVWVFVFFNAKQSSNPIATCNGCYCIVAEGEKCPEPVPVNNFSTVMINNLQTQKPVTCMRDEASGSFRVLFGGVGNQFIGHPDAAVLSTVGLIMNRENCSFSQSKQGIILRRLSLTR